MSSALLPDAFMERSPEQAMPVGIPTGSDHVVVLELAVPSDEALAMPQEVVMGTVGPLVLQETVVKSIDPMLAGGESVDGELQADEQPFEQQVAGGGLFRAVRTAKGSDPSQSSTAELPDERLDWRHMRRRRRGGRRRRRTSCPFHVTDSSSFGPEGASCGACTSGQDNQEGDSNETISTAPHVS